MITQEEVKRAQRKQSHCGIVMLLCGVVWGVTWYREGPTWAHEMSANIAIFSFFICFILSFVETAKEWQDEFAEKCRVPFQMNQAFAAAFDAAGEPSKDFWKRCEELKPVGYTIEEWTLILEEYRKKWSGEQSLV